MLTSSSLLIALSNNNVIILTLAQAKKKSSSSSLSPHRITKKGEAAEAESGPESIQFAEQPPIGTEPIALYTSNNSAYALTIAHRLAITSVNASKTQTRLHTSCLP